MRALAFKARVLFATRFAEMAEYRAEVVIWMLSGTLSLVMMLVWMAQAAAAPGGQIRGYSAPEFATYFLSTWLVSQLLVVWVSHELDFQIRQGTLSPQLLRPRAGESRPVSAERMVRMRSKSGRHAGAEVRGVQSARSDPTCRPTGNLMSFAIGHCERGKLVCNLRPYERIRV